MKSHLKHQTSKIEEQLKSHYYLHSGKFGLLLAHMQILGCKTSKLFFKPLNFIHWLILILFDKTFSSQSAILKNENKLYEYLNGF